MNSTSPGIPGFETLNVVTNGRGALLRARRLSDGRETIVKLIDPASDAILPRRLDRTRRTLSRLASTGRGIVPVLDHDIAEDGRPYLVLPHYPLGSLQDQLERGPMPWYLAAQLLERVTDIVGHAHDEGLAFGDLRPSKILLEAPESPLVSAFGMATRRFDDGQPSYRAPEASNDLPPSATGDAYSLALIFGALVAGEPKSQTETIDRFLGRLANLVPPRILDVLEHGLAESQTNRYRSASAMHRSLHRAIEETPRRQTDRGRTVAIDLREYLTSAPQTSIRADGPTAGDDAGLPDGLEDPAADADRDRALDADPGSLEEPNHHFRDPAHGDGVDGDGGARSGGADDGFDDERRLLPPGLDDLVLAPPSERHIDRFRDTIRFEIDDTDDLLADLLIGGADEEPTPHEAAGSDGADEEPPAHRADEATPDIAGDDRPADSAVEGADVTGEQEIVDLTELFTRTQEFVYEPDLVPSIEADDHEEDPDPDPDLGEDRHHEAISWTAADPIIAVPPPGQSTVADDDPTEVFPDVDEGREIETPLTGVGAGGPPFVDRDGSGAIPFPNMGRVRPGDESAGVLARTRVQAELVWFRSRRTLASVAAVLGLVAIVAIVVLVAARAIRSTTNSVETEGVPQQQTTATSSPDFVATDAPFITDVPPSYRSTTIPPTTQRRQTTTATAAAPSASSVVEVTPPTTTTSVGTTGTANTVTTRGSTTVPNSRTTRTRRRDRTTTTVPPPSTSIAPPSSEVLPPPTGASLGLRQAADPPRLTAPQVVAISRTGATIVYRSDECVATRFRLTGSDNSSQTGTSTGYDASVQCSAAWNLDFSGTSALLPGVAYTLAVSVKNTAGLVSNSSVEFTTPA